MVKFSFLQTILDLEKPTTHNLCIYSYVGYVLKTNFLGNKMDLANVKNIIQREATIG